ncbi:AAA family ATPase [Methanobrevibacter sp.]|uniref:AAA family ATPase n=1 Tax=Methanobrevibacter sp. TaxID=66852 RepID=UPI00386EA2E1
MILDKVIINNYRQYRHAEIEFSNETDKNFTIIQGTNGAGKTTLLNALSWCLYGEEIHDYGDEAAMDLCNNKTAFIASDGDTIQVSVQIDFTDEGKYLAFKRSRNYIKRGNKLIPAINSSDFQVIKEDNNGNITVEENDVYTRDRKIPQEIEDYFFFDGARLSEYFQENSNNNIKESVKVLSHLNLLNNASKNLPKVKEKYIHELKKKAPELGKAESKVLYYENELEKAEKDLVSYEDNLKIAETKIDEITEKLRAKKAYDVEQDMERYQYLNKEIKSLNSRLYDKNGLIQARINKVLKKYPYVLAYNYAKQFEELGEQYRKKGYIPPKYKRSFIQDLLDDGICICGADLTEDNEHRQHLEKLLELTKPITDKSEEVTVALANVKRNILLDSTNFKEDFINRYRNIKNLIDQKEELVAERQTIKAKLDANPYEEIQKLNAELTDYENQQKRFKNAIITVNKQIPEYKKQLGYWKQQRATEEKLSVECDEIRQKIALCDELIIVAKNVYHEMSDNIRNDIQEFTKDKFDKILWKKNEFVDIRINDNYEVFIKNKTGFEERPGDLSDGEKISLGLCFMYALHKYSGFELPIIMDTLLGPIGVEIRKNIATFLPHLVENKQTVLLVTGSEYTDEFRNILFDYIGKEYTIEWSNSDEGKESVIVENPLS